MTDNFTMALMLGGACMILGIIDLFFAYLIFGICSKKIVIVVGCLGLVATVVGIISIIKVIFW